MECVEDIAAKIDQLNIWDEVFDHSWAVKPKGSAFPHFCLVVKDKAPLVRHRLIILDGWQTFHDFMHFQADRDWAFYLSPMEFPSYEVVWLKNGRIMLFRHDPGYVPMGVPDEKAREMCEKILWESYGIMLRLEGGGSLKLPEEVEGPSMLMRQEVSAGVWKDVTLKIIPPRDHAETISIKRVDVAKAKGLPMPKGFNIEVGLRMISRMVTKEDRPRMLYVFAAADASSGQVWFMDQIAIDPEGGLRAMWENRSSALLAHFLEKQCIPSQVVVDTGRMFRMLRPLTMELPIKLVKCTEIKNFTQAVRNLV